MYLFVVEVSSFPPSVFSGGGGKNKLKKSGEIYSGMVFMFRKNSCMEYQGDRRDFAMEAVRIGAVKTEQDLARF